MGIGHRVQESLTKGVYLGQKVHGTTANLPELVEVLGVATLGERTSRSQESFYPDRFNILELSRAGCVFSWENGISRGRNFKWTVFYMCCMFPIPLHAATFT